MVKYNKKLLDWHRKEEEKKLLFTLTEKDLAESASAGRPGSGSTKLKSIKKPTTKYHSESDLRKYEALPPIATERGIPDGAMVADETPCAPPKPPQGFIVHLGITARTYSITEFHSNFIDEVNSYFIKGYVCFFYNKNCAKNAGAYVTIG